ncbi:DUF6984 family protein [Hymenobacter sublimis]|uniref:DUF6984 domain-containing protein n=1 Tax=Hymenobacter sublimis TaxID=2933777 RepID=A0ABY4JBJ6_9BACT|nr:hypothetical protein [Hymenobacter sublimis]UPL50198.1 hypothetical protein MWH26_04640 [Hymenobacter sublimis]
MMPRPLFPKEHWLVTFLLTGTSYADRLLPCLLEQRVTEMADGGMGSLQFYPPGLRGDRRFGDDVAEVWLKDEDEVPVLATLLMDQHGQLFELNVWKVNFSPTINLQIP